MNHIATTTVDLTDFVEITDEWLELKGFEVDHSADSDENGWIPEMTALSPANSDGVHLCFSRPGSKWTLYRYVRDGKSIEAPLPAYDDGNDIVKLAEMLDIKLKNDQPKKSPFDRTELPRLSVPCAVTQALFADKIALGQFCRQWMSRDCTKIGLVLVGDVSISDMDKDEFVKVSGKVALGTASHEDLRIKIVQLEEGLRRCQC